MNHNIITSYHVKLFQGPRDLSLLYFVGIMASRKTIRINFVGIPSQLKELVSKVPDHAQFIKRHSYLLNLVTSGFEEDIMSVVFQFFDLKHHYFTFLDYQLVPIMEEFSKLLGMPILDHITFISSEKVPRFEDIATTLHLKRSHIKANWEMRSRVKGLFAK